jgi:hypothetical protein
MRALIKVLALTQKKVLGMENSRDLRLRSWLLLQARSSFPKWITNCAGRYVEREREREREGDHNSNPMKMRLGVVVPTYNLSYSEGRRMKVVSSRPA